MLKIDDRTGSATDKSRGSLTDLIPRFQSYGIKVEKVRLDFGDFAWDGNGPSGIAQVGVERKKVAEYVQCIESARFSGFQLPGIANMYDYGYLLVEGFWGVLESGHLHINKQRQGILHRAFDNHLHTSEVKAGIIFRRTGSLDETIATVVNLYKWWQEPWESHRSHERVYAPAAGGSRQMLLQPREVLPVEYFLLGVKGLDQKAAKLAKKIKTVEKLMELSAEEIGEIRVSDSKGNLKRLGQGIGTAVWEALRK